MTAGTGVPGPGGPKAPESPAVQDTDRLREVAAEALDAAIDAAGRMHGDPQPTGDELADAVLAAVLPVHREMVLGEAADALDADADIENRERRSGGWPASELTEKCIRESADLVRRLAVSAPPTPPGSPPADERATAVETGRAVDDGVRELAVAPNVWVSFHGLDFAVAWHPVPGDSYRKVVKVIPHAKTPAAAVPGTGDDPPLAKLRDDLLWLTTERERLTAERDEALAKRDQMAENAAAWARNLQARTIAVREADRLRELVEAERDGYAAESRRLGDFANAKVQQLKKLREQHEANRSNRLVAAIFGAGKGAARPFAIYRPGETNSDGIIAQGAEFPDGFLAVREAGRFKVTTYDSMETFVGTHPDEFVRGTQVVWLSEDLGSLAEMETERDRLAETIRRYEPVIEAAKAWLAYGWNGSARLTAAIEALGDIPSPTAPEAAPVEPEGTPDA